MTTQKNNYTAKESLSDKAREIWLAGLGLFSTIEEEGERMFNRFLERGKELEEKGESFEKRAKERWDSFQSYFTERTDKMAEEFKQKLNESFPTVIEEKLQAALESFGVSSRSEVKELHEKVDKLTKAVAELSKKLESGPKTTDKKATAK